MSHHVEALQTVLANTYALYIKTQNYHWNVEGPNFQPLHTLFESQYDELAEAVDEIAERIRALGAKIDGTLSGFAKRKTLKDGRADLSDAEMVADLLEGHRVVVASLKVAMEAAEEADDQFTVDLMVSRTGAHEKAAWMLRASLPDAARKKQASAASYAKPKRAAKKIA